MKLLVVFLFFTLTISSNALNVKAPEGTLFKPIVIQTPKPVPTPTKTPIDPNIQKLDNVLRGALEGKGTVFVQCSLEYKVDPILVASISMLESKNGTSQWTRDYNNIGGLYGNSGRPSTFDSVDECIRYMCKTLRTMYYDEGLTTPEGIGPKYCPVGDPRDTKGLNKDWIKCVKKLVKEME